MNVVDSSAWLSYFAGDENAEHFAGPIEATDELLVPSVTMTEVFKNAFVQFRSVDLSVTVAVEGSKHFVHGHAFVAHGFLQLIQGRIGRPRFVAHGSCLAGVS